MPKVTNEWASGQMVFYPGADGPGKDWFVDSNTGSDSNSGKDWEHAKATADAAHNLAAAGDTIWLAPNHAETLNANDALDIDTAGVQMVGVVRGRQMPTFNITHIDGAIVVAGAGCTLANVRILGGVDNIVSTIEVDGADCSILNCEVRDVTGYVDDSILTSATADRLLIDGYRHIGKDGDGSASAIALVGADYLVIRNCDIYGTFSVAPIDFRTTASTNVQIYDCKLANEDDTGGANGVQCIMDTQDACTGVVGPNISMVLGVDAANVTGAIDATTGGSITFHVNPKGCTVCNAVNQGGLEINYTAVADA